MGEFWAAIVGALIGAFAGGGVSAWLQARQSDREKRERERALGYSLLFKLMRIYTDFSVVRCHVEECDLRADRDGLKRGWQSLKPIPNMPGKVNFSADEMALLLSLKTFDLFNLVLSLDVVHGSMLDILRLYAERRLAFQSALPAEMNGSIGQVDLRNLDPETRARALVISAELEDLDAAIRGSSLRDEAEARQALSNFSTAIIPVLGKIDLEIDTPRPKLERI